MGLVGVKWFLSPSVPAVAARRVDRLELVGQSRSFKVVRQVVEPGAVLVLQSNQRRHRCCPTPGAWRETPHRRDGRWAGLLAQLGTASRLPLGRGQWCLVDAMSGNTDLRLSNVTVTFSGWLGRRSGLSFDDKRLLASDRPRGVRHQVAVGGFWIIHCLEGASRRSYLRQ
jgi:hypothetical protein